MGLKSVWQPATDGDSTETREARDKMLVLQSVTARLAAPAYFREGFMTNSPGTEGDGLFFADRIEVASFPRAAPEIGHQEETHMTKSWNTTRKAARPALWCRVMGLAVMAFCLGALSTDNSQAQQIPRRLNSLQLVRPIAPAPVPPVERLRQEIIRAVDPRTGKIDVRQLRRPQQFPSSQPTAIGGTVVPLSAPKLFPSTQVPVTGGTVIPKTKPGDFPTAGQTPSEGKNGGSAEPCTPARSQ